MKAIVTIDGELLVARGTNGGLQGQKKAVKAIVDSLNHILQAGYEITIVHGNGPQVGNMLFRGEIASHAVPPVPLDVCGADTQGATGYFLLQSLQNLLKREGINRDVAAMITQVLVDVIDPEMTAPLKGVGPFFDAERAQKYNNTRGWDFLLVPGRGHQRAVPALLPQKVFEINSIRNLMENGTIVVCGGGGGIPVQYDKNGNLNGVEAVVNKSHTATLLADELEVDTVIFISEWEKIQQAFPSAVRNGFTQFTLTQLRDLIAETQDVLTDSMYLKLVASSKYLTTKGRSIWIIPPEHIEAIVKRDCGILLIPDPS
ncbi:MAG: hypothetical protein R3293_01765 [Candidatus Promineifilaceae bacterium]|nr:hypothetical protein [Candidatus Promineifilaceae bacterium]